MSADIRFSRAQLLKIIQSGEFLGKMVGNTGKKKKKNTIQFCCFFHKIYFA